MNSSNITTKLKAAVIIAAAMVLAAGCSSTKHEARTSPAPIVTTENRPSEAQAQPMGGTAAGGGTQSGAAAGGAQTSANDIVVPLQQEKLNVGTQQINEGGVRIRKEVKTETVNQPVQVRRETVTVERVPAGSMPADKQATGAQGGQGAQDNTLNTPFKDGELTINLNREEPTATTETVSAGSIVIHKNVTTEPVTIQRQVRREEATATPLGNTKDVTISSNLTSSANGATGGGPSTSGTSGGTGGSSKNITQLNQLTAAPDPTALAGQTVDLSNVKIQQVVGDQLVAVGPQTGSPIYVRSSQPLSGMSAGQSVNLKGTVRQVPSSVSTLGVGQQGAQALQGQEIFIDATKITPSDH